jgi:DNA-directed RNA polymerase subunit RPC12/RpoP
MTCLNTIELVVEAPAPRYYRDVTIRCGNTIAFSPNDVGTAYCPEHRAEADTDVRCPRCGVGGFKEYMLHDHYLIDCE